MAATGSNYCPDCGERYEDGDAHECSTAGMGEVLDRVRAELSATRAERDALADALWCAEDQWGEDYLWSKWGLSKALTAERKQALIAQRPNASDQRAEQETSHGK